MARIINHVAISNSKKLGIAKRRRWNWPKSGNVKTSEVTSRLFLPLMIFENNYSEMNPMKMMMRSSLILTIKIATGKRRWQSLKLILREQGHVNSFFIVKVSTSSTIKMSANLINKLMMLSWLLPNLLRWWNLILQEYWSLLRWESLTGGLMFIYKNRKKYDIPK